jgi:hypothetical protein
MLAPQTGTSAKQTRAIALAMAVLLAGRAAVLAATPARHPMTFFVTSVGVLGGADLGGISKRS